MRSSKKDVFRVGLTSDFMKPDGTIAYGDIGLSALDQADGVEWNFLDKQAEISPEVADEYDALIMLFGAVTKKTVQSAKRLSIVSRFGVGYDAIDVPACTEHGVILSTTVGASTRPVSTIAMLYILATSHKLQDKDRIARSSSWDERANYMGVGLTGRTLCIVGLGNIGKDLAKLIQPFEMRVIAVDPYVKQKDASPLGVTLIGMEEAMKQADFVVVTAALTEETRGLVGEKEFGLMKPSAFFINVARGPIANQAALTRALSEGRIAGAGLDV
ncbi:MAG: NAD(P)-dependent oxidoreductase, partial [Chloroflexi bacterium]|nr:NAD(P)-dependent oxidoreductase [Chloroflexota bacterium]